MSLRYMLDDEVVARFGNPTPFIHPDGSIGDGWPRSILTTISLPAPIPLAWTPPGMNSPPLVGVIRCHRKIADALKAAFDESYNVPEAWASINDFGGCYAWRNIRKSRTSLSRHSWAIAVDLDVKDNPLGAKGRVDERVVEAFERHGFLWGGNFKHRKDPMHWEPGVEV